MAAKQKVIHAEREKRKKKKDYDMVLIGDVFYVG